MARLDRLAAAAKEVAQIAAVIAREFDLGLVSKIAGFDDRTLEKALHQAGVQPDRRQPRRRTGRANFPT
jgi:predicted ATPase